jgi:hypothetical protein
MLGSWRRPASARRARMSWERDVTASPDSSVDKLSAPSEPQTAFQLWLHRVLMLLFVFFCATLGVLLVILPWRPEWTDNHFLLASPGLRAFVSNGFVRGLCSGLGLLDIWIGFWEAVHFHDQKLH